MKNVFLRLTGSLLLMISITPKISYYYLICEWNSIESKCLNNNVLHFVSYSLMPIHILMSVYKMLISHEYFRQTSGQELFSPFNFLTKFFWFLVRKNFINNDRLSVMSEFNIC